jgi:hypothetical protein
MSKLAPIQVAKKQKLLAQKVLLKISRLINYHTYLTSTGLDNPTQCFSPGSSRADETGAPHPYTTEKIDLFLSQFQALCADENI